MGKLSVHFRVTLESPFHNRSERYCK